MPLAFFFRDAEIVVSLEKTLAGQAVETEKVLDIVYQPQAVFRVRAVTRCTSSLEGHTEAVISVAFSPTGKYEGLGAGGGLGARQGHRAEPDSPVSGTWRAALETPQSASGTSARRRRSSQPKVGVGCARGRLLKARRDPSPCPGGHRAALGCCASHVAPSLGGELLCSTTEVKKG